MIKEEEINKVAEDYTEIECGLKLKLEEDWTVDDITDAFIKGAKWADKNPQSTWISIKEDLPCNHKELTPKDYTVEVLALDDCDSYIVVRMWKFHDKWVWGLDDLPITHWMRLPEPPKE